MRNLMKFGMVLVVLAMVTSVAFAGDNKWKDDDYGSWCDGNWDKGLPDCDDGRKVRIDDDEIVVIDCEEASADDVELRDNGMLIVGVVADPEADPPIDAVFAELTICGELEMSDESSNSNTTLNIVNGSVTVEGESKDVFEDSGGEIIIAAGSSLAFGHHVRIGDSNGDGCGDSYLLDIAGSFSFTNSGKRFEVYGGTLTIDLTGNGSFNSAGTTRLSRKDDAKTIVNISDNASFTHTRDVELGSSSSGAKCGASLEITISDNGSWDGISAEKNLEYKRSGQIVDIEITGNGSFGVWDMDGSDPILNLVVDGAGASFTIGDDLEAEIGSISIIEGTFTVADDFELGGKGDCSMTVEALGVVNIRNLIMEEADLTINDARMDVRDLEIDGDSSIEINGAGQLVIDKGDLDDYIDLIDDGQITTANAGMVIVVDEDITNDGKFTLQPAIPADVDIKPGSSSNPLRVNFGGSGVMPVAIIGTDDLDVITIDAGSATLGGVATVRKGKIGDVNGDGEPDLVLKFDRADILDALTDAHGDLADLPNRAKLTLTLFAESTEGLVSGTDTLVVLNRGRINRSRR